MDKFSLYIVPLLLIFCFSEMKSQTGNTGDEINPGTELSYKDFGIIFLEKSTRLKKTERLKLKKIVDDYTRLKKLNYYNSIWIECVFLSKKEKYNSIQKKRCYKLTKFFYKKDIDVNFITTRFLEIEIEDLKDINKIPLINIYYDNK